MKKLLTLLLITCAVWSGCKKSPVQTDPEPARASIYGTFRPVDALTGITASATINGQPVTLQAKTYAYGGFNLEGLVAGTYMISFLTSAAYVPFSTTVTLSPGQALNLGDVLVSPAQGAISGTVSPAGLPTSLTVGYHVGGAISSTSSSNSISSSGAFYAGHLTVGTYTISFSDVPGYVTPPGQTISVVNGQTTDLGNVTFQKAQPASISGTVTPAGAAASVTVSRLAFLYTAAIPAQTFTATPDANGHFSVTGLDAAYTYDITVNPAPGSTLNAPNKIRLFLPSGQATDLGNLELTATPASAPISYDQGSTSVIVPTVTASYANGKLTISQFPALSGSNISLVINNLNGTGDYACSTASGSRITLITRRNPDPINWESNGSGGDGLIRVTAFDPVHQTLSGTFSATLVNNPGTIRLTNGAFNHIHYSKP